MIESNGYGISSIKTTSIPAAVVGGFAVSLFGEKKRENNGLKRFQCDQSRMGQNISSHVEDVSLNSTVCM